jgi:hypothetical protein
MICNRSPQVALRIADWHDLANEVVAHRIIALAKAGERDRERLCDTVLNEFGVPPRCEKAG